MSEGEQIAQNYQDCLLLAAPAITPLPPSGAKWADRFAVRHSSHSVNDIHCRKPLSEYNQRLRSTPAFADGNIRILA